MRIFSSDSKQKSGKTNYQILLLQISTGNRSSLHTCPWKACRWNQNNCFLLPALGKYCRQTL